MKVFLLISMASYDLDIIYGIYSSLENAEIAQSGIQDANAEIKELKLDTTYVGGV